MDLGEIQKQLEIANTRAYYAGAENVKQALIEAIDKIPEATKEDIVYLIKNMDVAETP
jgi:hypothetical protein